MNNPFEYLNRAREGARYRELFEEEQRRHRREQQQDQMVREFRRRRGRADRRVCEYFRYARLVVRLLQDLKIAAYPDSTTGSLLSDYQVFKIHQYVPESWAIWREYYTLSPGAPTGEGFPHPPEWVRTGEKQVTITLVMDWNDRPDYFLVSRAGTHPQITPFPPYGERVAQLAYQPVTCRLTREALLQALIVLHPPDRI